MEIPRHWRLNQQRYGLVGEKCPDPECQTYMFPPRDVCKGCSGEVKIKPEEITGAIYDRTMRLVDAPQQS